MIRFHLDEHIPAAVAEGLRRRGMDATTTVQAGLLGANDETQLRYALSHDRVLVTSDADFLRLHERETPHAGIVYGPKGKHSIGELLHGLIMIAECLSPEDMRGYVEFL